MYNNPAVWHKFILIVGIWGTSSFMMMVWFLIYGLYYRDEPVLVVDAIKAIFISLIPLVAPLGLIVWGIFYLEDHGNKVLFRSKKAAAKEMLERIDKSAHTSRR